MDEYLVDLSSVTDRHSLHRRLREALPLPEWYGSNLDALYDFLTDLPVPVTIRFSGSEKAKDRLDDYFELFRRVLRDAQSALPGLTVLFEDPGSGNHEEPDLEKIYEAQGETENDRDPEYGLKEDPEKDPEEEESEKDPEEG